MIYALDIELEKNDDKCKLYNKIFALDGGIYDKCRTNGESYGNGTEYHELTSSNKESLDKIAQEIAFALFEKEGKNIKSDIEERLEKKEYENIIKEIDENRLKDFAIANYYDIGVKLQFIHRSIYEYFTAEYIYQAITKYIEEENQEELAKTLARLFKKNIISDEIKEFLSYKLEKNVETSSEKFYKFLEGTIELMIEYGMTYYLEEKEKNILKCEEEIFVSSMILLHIIFNLIKNKDIIFNNLEDKKNLEKQILNCRDYKQDLSYINLNGVNLIGAGLNGADLIGTDLRESNLIGADLNGANLIGADLSESNLRRTNLSLANLNGANLSGANLSEADLNGVNLIGANLIGANLSLANLSLANLNEANLTEVDLTGAKLTGAKLTGTNLSEANLKGADLTRANLIGANLSLANLTEVDLIETKFDDINIKVIENQKDTVENINGCYVYHKESKEYLKYPNYKKLGGC